MVIAELVRRLLRTFRSGNFGILASATLIIIALGTFGSFFAEKGVNSNFSNLGDSLWWTIVTLSTVGFGDIVPITVAGRIIAGICMIAGPVLIVSFVGSVGFHIYERWTKGVRGMARVKTKGHLIICGWNRQTKEIIDELRLSTLRNLPITIIDNNIQSKPVESSRISFVHGNACEIEILTRANIAQAKFVIVLAENGLPTADQKTVLTILAVKKCNRSVITCAELNDSNNEDHLKEAGCEIVVKSTDLSARLLAMSLLNPSANAVIMDLVSQEGSEIYRVSPPEKYIGRQFLDALSELKQTQGFITIGIERNGKAIVNPNASEIIATADKLLVVAEDAPSY